jgi:hypothetical protein
MSYSFGAFRINKLLLANNTTVPLDKVSFFLLVMWDKVKKNGNHFSYSLITSNGNSLMINEMDF